MAKPKKKFQVNNVADELLAVHFLESEKSSVYQTLNSIEGIIKVIPQSGYVFVVCSPLYDIDEIKQEIETLL